MLQTHKCRSDLFSFYVPNIWEKNANKEFTDCEKKIEKCLVASDAYHNDSSSDKEEFSTDDQSSSNGTYDGLME
jgi:hypothetical protein